MKARYLLIGLLLFAVTQLKAQQGADERSTPRRVNSLVLEAKRGSGPAIREMTDLLLQTAGVNPDIANAFDFRERLVQAELKFRNGKHKGVNEIEVSQSLNSLADRLGLPEYAHTSKREIRRLRMRLLPAFTQLLVSDKPDKAGKYKALEEEMSPVEALFITAALVEQKISNPDFQKTEQERHRKTEIKDRSAEVLTAINTGTANLSLRDLVAEADGLLTTLGIDPLQQEEK